MSAGGDLITTHPAHAIEEYNKLCGGGRVQHETWNTFYDLAENIEKATL